MAESRHSRVRTDVFHVIARVPKTPSSRVTVFRGLVQSQGRRVIHHLLGQVEDFASLQISDTDCGLKFLGKRKRRNLSFFSSSGEVWERSKMEIII